MSTITITASKDSIMGKAQSGSFSGWNGKDDHLWIGSDFSGSFKNRACVYFPIDFGPMLSITSATLKFYRHAPGSHVTPSNPATLEVWRMTADWGEGADVGEGTLSSTQSWDWDSRNGSNSQVDQVQAFPGTGNSGGDDGTLTSWDVTDTVQKWFTGTANYGFMIHNTSENNVGAGREYYSRNHSTQKPELVIVYTSNTPPNAPTGLSPTGGEIKTSLTPAFTGTRSDPDSGDYITGLQVRVFPNSATSISDSNLWDSGFINRSGTPTTFSVTYNSEGANAGDGATLVGNVFYKWAARTYDKNNESGSWSALQQFKINLTPNSPTVVINSTPTSDVPTNTPIFQITHNDPDPTDTKMYGHQVIVEVNSNPAGTGTWSTAWDSGQVDDSGAPITTKTVTSGTLGWGALHRVKARTKDSNGAWSGYSGTQQFTTHKTGVPINLSPIGSASVGATPTFSGERASTVDSITSYDIIVYSDSLSSTIWSSGTLSTGISGGDTFSKLIGVTLTPNTYYQWKIRVTSTIGGTSDYSSLQRFFVADATVPTVTLPTTNDGTRVTTLTPAIIASRATSFNRAEYQLYPSAATDATVGSFSSGSGPDATHYYTLTAQSSTIGAGGLGTQYTSTAYGGTALAWNTTYKVRVRVSSDAGANYTAWSGLVPFSTDLAQTPTLTSPAANAWITDSTPDLTVTRGGSDTIDKVQVRVWTVASIPVLIWDSGYVDVTNASTGTVTYAGPTLSPGTYQWDASIQKTTGPTSAFAAKQKFILNSPPDIPSQLFPTPSYVFADTLLPTFQAVFSDPDVQGQGDTPSAWDIIVEDSVGNPIAHKTVSSSLIVGLNEWTPASQGDWTWDNGVAADTLVYSTDYRFKTRFADSKSVYGNYSGYNAFRLGQSPNGTITTPSNGSSVNVVTPNIDWTYSGGTQQKFVFTVDETQSDGTVIARRYSTTQTTATHSFDVPAGYLKNDHYYNLTVTVYNTDNLADPTPSTVNVYVALDAPDPITGLSPTVVDEQSLIQLDWDIASLKSGHSFVAYNIYRRLQGDNDWTLVGNAPTRTDPHYDDYYAGDGINYQYRVTITTTKTGVGIELESPDDSDGGSIVPVVMDTDVWMLVGNDRDLEHIQELPVTDESHQRLLQQEAFETIGSNRKVIIRGYVLGNEGQITMLYKNELVASPADPQIFFTETVIGRRLLDYITANKGPHILKSPFGDVWDVTVEGPQYQWMPVGHLEVQLSWTEVGTTSQVSI